MHKASILDAIRHIHSVEVNITGAEHSPIHITHVSTADLAGGAERVAATIHMACLEAGLKSTLAVGFKFIDLPHTVLIPNDAQRGMWAKALNALAPHVPSPPATLSPGSRMIRQAVKAFAEPQRAWRISRGLEDVDFPGTASIALLGESPPDVVQLHNLHGGYFDIRELPKLCETQPTVLTAHDTWLTSGHCAYSVDCDAWLTGCGSCPHLDFPPTVRRDRTAENWALKRAIFEDRRTRLHLVSPSKWALDRLHESIFAPAIETARVIANGVDQRVFRPGDRQAARLHLGIEANALVFVFTTASASSPYKDPATVEASLSIVASELARDTGAKSADAQLRPVVFLMLGASGGQSTFEGGRTLRVPYLAEPGDVARCLQAADIYLHAAKAEVLPLGILEAQSCGLPAIVTRTGGAPECVAEGETGFVVKQNDASDMARAALVLARDEKLRETMGEAAVLRARQSFSVQRMTQQYIELYESLAVVQP